MLHRNAASRPEKYMVLQHGRQWSMFSKFAKRNIRAVKGFYRCVQPRHFEDFHVSDLCPYDCSFSIITSALQWSRETIRGRWNTNAAMLIIRAVQTIRKNGLYTELGARSGPERSIHSCILPMPNLIETYCVVLEMSCFEATSVLGVHLQHRSRFKPWKLAKRKTLDHSQCQSLRTPVTGHFNRKVALRGFILHSITPFIQMQRKHRFWFEPISKIMFGQ